MFQYFYDSDLGVKARRALLAARHSSAERKENTMAMQILEGCRQRTPSKDRVPKTPRRLHQDPARHRPCIAQLSDETKPDDIPSQGFGGDRKTAL